MLAALATTLVAAGLAAAVVMVLLPRPARAGVARSLELARGLPEVPDVVPLAEQSTGQRVWRPLLAGLGRLGARVTPVGTPQRLRRRMDLAGNVAPWDVEGILAIKAVSLLGLGGLGVLVLLVTRSALGLLCCALFVAAGYWLADVLLHGAGRRRQAAMRRAAPDALDMLTVCVEAGLGFDAGLAQVATKTTGPLAAELARALKELQLGQSRATALGDLAARTDVVEIRSAMAALIQADRLGVPIAGVLREQARELRTRRRQRAEERAQKIPVKIIFPVLFGIFPAFFVVVIGPGVIRIVQAFSHG